MESNDTATQEPTTPEVDKTTENEVAEKFETVDAQRRHWKEQAIDPETGKKYKELVEELKQQPKPDKTEKNDKSSSKEEKPDESVVLQERIDKLALKSAGITHEDDVKLAQETAKKWGMDIESVVDDEDFKVKLQRQQDNRAALDASSNVEGDKGTGSSPKNTPEYWQKLGRPPSAEEVPDRKTRAKIARSFMSQAKEGKKFYND